MVVEILDAIHKRLPEKWQRRMSAASYAVFSVYYNTKMAIPYIKAKHRIAFHEKYLNSEVYHTLLRQQTHEWAVNMYFQNRLWTVYGQQLTLWEKLKCLFIPYTVIDKYEGNRAEE